MEAGETISANSTEASVCTSNTSSIQEKTTIQADQQAGVDSRGVHAIGLAECFHPRSVCLRAVQLSYREIKLILF